MPPQLPRLKTLLRATLLRATLLRLTLPLLNLLRGRTPIRLRLRLPMKKKARCCSSGWSRRSVGNT